MNEKMEVAKWTFETMDVRVIADEKGETWWCGKDVCTVLGYSNDSKAINDHCKEKGVTKRYTLTDGGKQELLYINESNLYRMIIKSKKTEAEKFEEWVFETVLPEIRRTGKFYIHKERLYSEFEVIRQIEKQSFKSMALSLKESGENERMHGHAYSTYNNMIYRMILGRTSKQLKEEMDLKKCASIKDYIGEDKLKDIERAENLVHSLLNIGMEYKEIEQYLEMAMIKRIA